MSARHNAYGTRSRLRLPEAHGHAPQKLNRVNIMRGKNHIRTKLSNSLYGEFHAGSRQRICQRLRWGKDTCRTLFSVKLGNIGGALGECQYSQLCSALSNTGAQSCQR